MVEVLGVDEAAKTWADRRSKTLKWLLCIHTNTSLSFLDIYTYLPVRGYRYTSGLTLLDFLFSIFILPSFKEQRPANFFLFFPFGFGLDLPFCDVKEKTAEHLLFNFVGAMSGGFFQSPLL